MDKVFYTLLAGCLAVTGCAVSSSHTGCAGLVPPPPGTICADGTIYAGKSPDGNTYMYTTPEDAPLLLPWNNGKVLETINFGNRTRRIFGSYDTMENCTSEGMEASCHTGVHNTALLYASVDRGTPYEAAAYCAGLEAHNHNDWYLPAWSELNVLHNNHAAIGNFNTSGFFTQGGSYWSSSERDNFYAINRDFSDTAPFPMFFSAKPYALSVRCVRKE